MGIFSRSSSSQTTYNQDNRKIEENQNEGDFSGNKGEITINSTGGEAWDFATEVVKTSTDTLAQAFNELGARQSETLSETLTAGQAGIVSSLGGTFKVAAIAAAVAWAIRGLK